jgi:hypothetical protein
MVGLWIITQCWLRVDTDVSRKNAASNFRVTILHPLGYRSVSEEEMICACVGLQKLTHLLLSVISVPTGT